MDKTRTVKKLTEWKPYSSRPVGRPRLRWLDQVEDDLKKMKVRNWRKKCKDRRLWNEIVKQAKTHQGLWRRLKKKKCVLRRYRKRTGKRMDFSTGCILAS